MTLPWDRTPTWHDPRVPFLGLLLCYLVLGVTVLGFNRSPAQIAITIGAACVLDMALHYGLRGRRLLFPLSGAITGASLAILLNYAHGLWFALLPVCLAVLSKYALTHNGRHVFNPSLFGVVVALLASDGMISASPAYQWGGSAAMAAFIVTAALVLFVFRIRRAPLIVAFLGFYLVALGIRAWLTRWHIPPETVLLGTLTSPAFYLFTFFMITDPATSPNSARGQVLMALVIVLVDFGLHKVQAYSTLFYAGFAYFCGRFIYLHLRKAEWNAGRWRERLGCAAPRLACAVAAGFVVLAFRPQWSALADAPGEFRFEPVDVRAAGITSRPGDVLEQVDPRVAHVAKWLLSIGDAVAVADADGDGRLDVFLTYPMKDARDRAALYLNRGGFQFERAELPALRTLTESAQTQGLPSGALWFDYDNDGDTDLLVLVSFGHPRLLENRLQEDGRLAFVDVSRRAGLTAYTTAVAANVLDADRDGRLDLLIGNATNPYLPDYPAPTPFNLFSLPEPEYPGDRRMFNFMHRTWHDADNGGENLFYLNHGDRFEAQPIEDFGLAGQRWTMAIGTGDLNRDGFTDLYLANDFGPDALYLNRAGRGFESVRGRLVGSLGRDTYKGMNASFGDLDNNGFDDIYVSNVHEPLQAEGSLLWMNAGTVDSAGPRAFTDQAVPRNALNEKRFGWGAAMGDLDRDGRLDIVQANGMVDDAYDAIGPDCEDYWYWNARIALTGPDIHGYADRWADLRGRCIFPMERNRVYLNRGKHFVDVAESVGLDAPGNSRGIALADLDNDGDLDMLVTHQFAPVSMYRNESLPRPWLGLELHGNGKPGSGGCNRDAIGTRVELRGAGSDVVQTREVRASNGFSAQGDSRLLFGLSREAATEVHIHWCGEAAPQVLNLQPMRYHVVTQTGQT